LFFSKFRPMVRIRGRTLGRLLGVAALGSIVLATLLAPTASASTPPQVSSGDINAEVFPIPFANCNSVSPCLFLTPTAPAVFTREGFPNLTFNPPSGAGICGGTAYDSNRPFVFVNPETCHLRILQNRAHTELAGSVGTGGIDLSEFEVEFYGHIHVNSAGDVAFTAYVDDSARIGLGLNEDGNQPTDVDASGPPTAKKGYNDMFNPGLGVTTSTVHFPAAGTYPIEIDYVECCGSTLSMTLLANGAPLDNR